MPAVFVLIWATGFIVARYGIPIGATVEGAGMVQSKMPNRRADLEAGAKVYADKCAVCHGADGQGIRAGKLGDAQGSRGLLACRLRRGKARRHRGCKFRNPKPRS